MQPSGSLALSRARRGLAAAGALLCAVGVALSAYAAHGLDPDARTRIAPALLFLLLHGFALAVFAPRQRGRIEWAALWCWLLGSLLFSGSLVLAVLVATPTAPAPFGGLLLILGWLLQGLASLRR